MKFLVVCHDAGGAEVVSAWVRRHPEHEYQFILAGPAVRIFQGKLGISEFFPDSSAVDETCWSGIDVVLCGTSWASDLERKSILAARLRRIKSIAFLDHWVNYRERFGFPNEGWESGLPDEVWCGDDESLKIAGTLFGAGRVRLEPNPYFLDIDDQFQSLPCVKPEEMFDCLYVAEPIAEHMLAQHGDENFLGYTEFSALANAVSFLGNNFAAVNIPVRLLLRPHPAEPAGKYTALLGSLCEARVAYDVSSGHSLLEDIKRSRIVIGCESMAMVIALKLGKKVYTSIPDGGRKCVLPFGEIVPLKD